MDETTAIVIPPTEPPASPPETEQAATDAAATAEQAAADAMAAATAAEQSARDSSLNASVANDAADLLTQNKLLRDNLELVFRKVDQLGGVLQGALAPFQGALEEMDTTAELMQQVISRADEQQEQLGVALAALAKLTVELTAALAQVAMLPKASK